MVAVAKVFFSVIGVMFAVGIIGSALVVLLTAVEDVKELVGDQKPEPRRGASDQFLPSAP